MLSLVICNLRSDIRICLWSLWRCFLAPISAKTTTRLRFFRLWTTNESLLLSRLPRWHRYPSGSFDEWLIWKLIFRFKKCAIPPNIFKRQIKQTADSIHLWDSSFLEKAGISLTNNPLTIVRTFMRKFLWFLRFILFLYFCREDTNFQPRKSRLVMPLINGRSLMELVRLVGKSTKCCSRRRW